MSDLLTTTSLPAESAQDGATPTPSNAATPPTSKPDSNPSAPATQPKPDTTPAPPLSNPTPAPAPAPVPAPGPVPPVVRKMPDFPPWVDNSKMTLTPWKKDSLTILLIGETGVGKTAFMDLLANVCAGRVMEDFKAEHKKDNEAGGSGSGSQTNKPKLYHIKCANGYMVHVLDTPGLADTRGTDFDDAHKAAIAETIKDQIETIDCVLILANGTQERLPIPTKYAITVISGMFPSSIVDNMAFIFTMVANPLQFNFKREGLDVAVRKTKFWAIDNPLAGWLKYQKSLNDEEPPEDFILEDMRETVHATYAKTMKTLNSFFKWVDEGKVQPVKEINDLYNMSNKIEASISDVLARITQTEAQKTELIKLQNQIDTQKQIKKINENFTTIINKPFHVHEGTGEVHNTLCCASECYNNCHEKCSVSFTLDRDKLGRDCNAFWKQRIGPDGGYICDECGHSSKLHQHYRDKWVIKENIETTEDKIAKEKFLAASSEEDRILVMKQNIDEKLKKLETSMADDEEQLSSICSEYNKLALSGSFVGYISQAILLLQMHEKKMTEEGAPADALARMAERIKSLQKRRDVVEQAMRDKKAKNGVVGYLKDKLKSTKEAFIG
ncbi:hypothetical protein BDN71DRAFT_1433064 [Pleurotus eryngii]|uniref:AIG1-type G domain-containing protein n=1 Tax=Pleurotus eryngii TaxID=5323 RepID=A0A9P5ZU21_PLEER|nr:hypothetical protein BDN71DRAFT_1433064 [Pleurotus eryngii]